MLYLMSFFTPLLEMSSKPTRQKSPLKINLAIALKNVEPNSGQITLISFLEETARFRNIYTISKIRD